MKEGKGELVCDILRTTSGVAGVLKLDLLPTLAHTLISR